MLKCWIESNYVNWYQLSKWKLLRTIDSFSLKWHQLNMYVRSLVYTKYEVTSYVIHTTSFILDVCLLFRLVFILNIFMSSSWLNSFKEREKRSFFKGCTKFIIKPRYIKHRHERDVERLMFIFEQIKLYFLPIPSKRVILSSF